MLRPHLPAIASVLVVSLSLGTVAAAQTRGPADVIRAYYEALNASDARAAAALIAPDARIQTPGGAPATSVQNFIRVEIDERTPVEIVDLQVSANQVTWVETRTGADGASLGPRGTATVEGGLIRSLEFGPPVEVFGGSRLGLPAPPAQPATGAGVSRPAEATALPPVPDALPRTGSWLLLPGGALGGLAAVALGWALRRRSVA